MMHRMILKTVLLRLKLILTLLVQGGLIWGGCLVQEAAGGNHLPQHFLYFLPEPQGHGSLGPTFGVVRT